MRILFCVGESAPASAALVEGSFEGFGESARILWEQGTIPLGELLSVRLVEVGHRSMARVTTSRSTTVYLCVPRTFPMTGTSITIDNAPATERLALQLRENVRGGVAGI